MRLEEAVDFMAGLETEQPPKVRFVETTGAIFVGETAAVGGGAGQLLDPRLDGVGAPVDHRADREQMKKERRPTRAGRRSANAKTSQYAIA